MYTGIIAMLSGIPYPKGHETTLKQPKRGNDSGPRNVLRTDSICVKALAQSSFEKVEQLARESL